MFPLSSPPVPTAPPSGPTPVSTAAGMAVLETLDQTFLDGVKEKGAYLRAGIEAIGSPTWARWWVWA